MNGMKQITNSQKQKPRVMSIADVAKFDAMLSKLHPKKRAGFVDSAHAEASHEKIRFDSMEAAEAFADVEQKHGYTHHAKKIRENLVFFVRYEMIRDSLGRHAQIHNKDLLRMLDFGDREMGYDRNAEKGTLNFPLIPGVDWKGKSTISSRNMPIHAGISAIRDGGPIFFDMHTDFGPFDEIKMRDGKTTPSGYGLAPFKGPQLYTPEDMRKDIILENVASLPDEKGKEGILGIVAKARDMLARAMRLVTGNKDQPESQNGI